MRRIPQFGRVSDYLFHYTDAQPNREAIVFDEQRITYRDLAGEVRRCARGLISIGMGKGDRVAVLSTPRPEHFIIFLATAMIGGIWLGLNPRHTLEELSDVIGDASPRILFSLCKFENRHFEPVIRALKNRFPSIDRLVLLSEGCEGLIEYQHLLKEPQVSLDAAVEEAAGRVVTEDPAAIIYSSGTTGKPKGVVLSHYSFIRGYMTQYAHWAVSPLRLLNNLPINHIASLGDLSIYGLLAGGTIVFMERFLADRAVELIESERITFLQQFPTQLQLILDAYASRTSDLSSLEVIAWGGAPASRDIIRRLLQIGARLYNSYGQTECGAPIFFTDDGADIEILADTVGRPDPHYAVQITDVNGNPAVEGHPGEILVRGDTLMLGYFNRPHETAKALSADGWLHTGDAAICRPDGNFQLVGRLKDMYKSGGYTIFPREIENILEGHPTVVLAAVVSVPDPLFHEVGHAFLVPADSRQRELDQIIKHCREHLANYKIPKRFSFLDRLPTLPNGKVDKLALRNFALSEIRKPI